LLWEKGDEITLLKIIREIKFKNSKRTVFKGQKLPTLLGPLLMSEQLSPIMGQNYICLLVRYMKKELFR
jgi:hypothetical protein